MSEIQELTEVLSKRTKKTLIYGVGFNDSPTPVVETVFGKLVTCPYYRVWTRMLERCYSAKSLAAKPSYIGCTVAPTWHSFSNFKLWMQEQDWKNKELDKDILVKDNKVYSPETCLFVSHHVNVLLIKNTKPESTRLKLGVYLDNTGNKFVAKCNNGIKAIHLGTFKTEDEAHLTYLKFKKIVIQNLANEQTDLRLKQALLTIANSYTI